VSVVGLNTSLSGWRALCYTTLLLGHNKYKNTLFAFFLSPSANGKIQSLDFWIMCLAFYRSTTVKRNKKFITLTFQGQVHQQHLLPQGQQPWLQVGKNFWKPKNVILFISNWKCFFLHSSSSSLMLKQKAWTFAPGRFYSLAGMIETHQNPKFYLISKFFILTLHLLFCICWSLILCYQLGTETSHFRFVGCLKVRSCLQPSLILGSEAWSSFRLAHV